MDVDAYVANVEAIVGRVGVCIQHVGGGEGDATFSYTVGLFLQDHAEFVLVGAPRDLARDLLNDLAFSVLRSDVHFEVGDHVHRLIGEGVVVLVDVDDPCTHVRVACEMNARRGAASGTPPVRALQVIFADRGGLWPWDVDCEVTAPMLGPRPPGEGRDQWLPDAATRREQGW